MLECLGKTIIQHMSEKETISLFPFCEMVQTNEKKNTVIYRSR